MKFFFQFILSFFVFQLGAQTDSVIPHRKFDLGFSGSPDYSYRVLKAGESDNWIKNIYDTSEVARVGYTAGMQIVFHATENLFFNSAVLFTDRGEKTKKYLIPRVSNYINHYYYLSVPLKVSYYIIGRKTKLFLTAGFSADIYLGGRSDVEYGTSGLTKPRALSSATRLNILFNAGFGIDCPLTNRWYLKLQPEYRRSLTPVYNSPIKKYFYAAGLSLGFFCRF